MKRFLHGCRTWIGEAVDFLKRLTGDEGCLLILAGAPLIYATLYSLAYGSELLREVPIGVVTPEPTPFTREMTMALEASPELKVSYQAGSMKEARELLWERKIDGIVYLPHELEEHILQGNSGVVSLCLDADCFLIYRQLYRATAAVIMAQTEHIAQERLWAKAGTFQAPPEALDPIRHRSENLYNPSLGYGSFILPAILLLVLQQTLLIGVGMCLATRRERTKAHLGMVIKPKKKPLSSALIQQSGQSLAVLLLSGLVAIYLLTLHYRLFHLPMRGSTGSIALLILLFLLASVQLAFALGTLFRRREEPLIWLLWSSIPCLMLSGVSLPPQALAAPLRLVGALLPSTPAIRAFIRLQSMGAHWEEVMPEMLHLGVLCLLYGFVAWWRLRKSNE